MAVTIMTGIERRMSTKGSMPETPDTVKFLDDRRLSLMKKGSILLNVGRGTTIDTDALVKNAGIGSPHLPTTEQTLESFYKVLSIHLGGTFLCAREAHPLLKAGGAGAIVNISSIAGVTGLPRRNAYGAAKAGIAMMTRSLACEWAADGIRVNAVAPGFVATALVKKLEADGFVDGPRLQRRIPMARLADPAEIAQAIQFLASKAASYITGTVLSVDGGWAAFGDAGDASSPT